MADEQEQSKSEGASALKVVAVLLAVLFLEIGGIFLYLHFMGQGNPPTAATGRPDPAGMMMDGAQTEEDEQSKLMELVVVDDKFVNSSTGQMFLYDVKIVMLVRKPLVESLKKRLEEQTARVTSEIAAIMRKASPQAFKEERLQTLSSQLLARLRDHFGKDANDKPIVQEILIPKMILLRRL